MHELIYIVLMLLIYMLILLVVLRDYQENGFTATGTSPSDSSSSLLARLKAENLQLQERCLVLPEL